MITENLIEFYLDYLNNFVSYKTMASYYGINSDDLLSILAIGKKLHEDSAITKEDK